jgi:hypothetical protein
MSGFLQAILNNEKFNHPHNYVLEIFQGFLKYISYPSWLREFN